MSKRVKDCATPGCDKRITRDAAHCGSCSKKGSTPWNKGQPWPESSLRQKGPLNTQWKGEDAGYSAIHVWLQRNFGKANRCEECDRLGRTPKVAIFHWAKLKGKEYEHKRENFWMLCVTCHNDYDRADQDERNRQIESLFAQGLSRKAIARRIGMSDVGVGNILRGKESLLTPGAV